MRRIAVQKRRVPPLNSDLEGLLRRQASDFTVIYLCATGVKRAMYLPFDWPWKRTRLLGSVLGSDFTHRGLEVTVPIFGGGQRGLVMGDGTDKEKALAWHRALLCVLRIVPFRDGGDCGRVYELETNRHSAG